MFILLGSPGAGKSTQAELLQERLGYKWISTGRLLRETGDPKILAELKTGNLLSNDIVQGIFEEALKSTPEEQEILVDGYPRDDEQIDVMMNHIVKVHRPIKAVVFIKLDHDEAVKRMLDRGRADDTLEVVNHRISEVYEKELAPIINGFKAHDIQILTINGKGSIEEVYEKLKEAILAFDPNGGKRDEDGR